MFRQATDYVIHHFDDEALRSKFAIPSKLWPIIRKSWYHRNRDNISGRFDFCLTGTGVKVYEYNADSASTLFECGVLQDAWAKAVGLKGQNAGELVESELTDSWKRVKVNGTLHLLYDENKEEEYHTMYMMQIAQKAGLKCKLVKGLKSLNWSDKGEVVDENGEIIKNVWKTWSWTTAIDQIADKGLEDFLARLEEREKCADDKKRNFVPGSQKPALADVLFDPSVRVFEPLWTLIPASKAILPVLSQLYPDHPLLLHSTFEPTAEMKANGYVEKPVRGRCGQNIRIIGANGKPIDLSSGKWATDPVVYQELCLLPKFETEYVQVNCFVSGTKYLGPVLRVETKSSIVDVDSDIYSLRLLDEKS